jgi:hypothetical protein
LLRRLAEGPGLALDRQTPGLKGLVEEELVEAEGETEPKTYKVAVPLFARWIATEA